MGEPGDEELAKLTKVLDALLDVDDVRDHLPQLQQGSAFAF